MIDNIKSDKFKLPWVVQSFTLPDLCQPSQPNSYYTHLALSIPTCCQPALLRFPEGTWCFSFCAFAYAILSIHQMRNTTCVTTVMKTSLTSGVLTAITKHDKLGGINNRSLFAHILEAGNLKLRWEHGWVLMKALFLLETANFPMNPMVKTGLESSLEFLL